MEKKKLIKLKGEVKEMTCTEVYEQFRGLNVNWAKGFLNSGDRLEDLIQVTNVGLVKAFNLYNVDFGNSFSTFLGAVVNNQLKLHLRNLRKSKYEPSLDYYEFKNNEGKSMNLLDKLEDPLNYEEIALHSTMIADIGKLRDELNPIAKEIIECLYFKDMTQYQVGKILNYSQVQISRILKKSLKILKFRYETDERLVAMR